MCIIFNIQNSLKFMKLAKLGWSKKKMNKKKGTTTTTTTTNFVPGQTFYLFFFKFSHLCSFFSLQKVFMVSTTYQLFAKDILTKSFVRKKFFLKKNSNFSKKIFLNFFFSKKFFSKKKFEIFFFFEKIFLNFFFFEKMFFDFNLKLKLTGPSEVRQII